MTAPRSPAQVATPFSRRSLPRLAMTFLALVCLSLLAVQGWSSYSARETYLDDANISTINMASALADHAEASFNLADTTLLGIVERVEHGELETQADRMHALLTNLVARTPSLQGLFVYGADGRWLLTSLERIPANANNADREYFEYHRTHAALGAHVGSPVRSRSSGAWVVPVSRRINGADGSFAGVALATLKLAFFKSYYQSFDIGNHGTIFLASDSGRFVVRRPFSEKDYGGDISHGPLFHLWQQSRTVSGSAILTANIDKVERLYTYHHLQNYPLLIAVAVAKDEVLQRWRASTISAIAGTLCLIVLLLFLGARMIGQLIERDRLQRQLRAAKSALETTNASLQLLAMSDGLTGLANRRHFDDRLDSEFRRAIRDQSPLALVILDIDYFKRFNDRQGHVAGDACLQQVAQAVLSGQRRPADVAARFGGEEFIILLPDTDLAGALLVAEKIRAAIAALQCAHGGSPFHVVTASVGVHARVPARGQAPRSMVEAADQALYLAKAEGRNRVCSAA
jgi:diguanylate cyclase (GGDEF)-like protein